MKRPGPFPLNTQLKRQHNKGVSNGAKHVVTPFAGAKVAPTYFRARSGALCVLLKLLRSFKIGLYSTIMGSNKLKIPPEFISAPKEQRIEFVQDLWDQIAQDPEAVPVPESHKQILKERLEKYRSNPQPGRLWGEVRDQLLDKLSKD